MTSPNQNLEIRHQNSSNANTSQQECTNTKKVGRGKTTGLRVAKKKKKSTTGKLRVIIPENKMVAVGSGAADFVTEISIIVQKNAPLNVTKWNKIPEQKRTDIVTKVLDTFDINNTEHNKDVILHTARRLYRSHRCRLHQHFKQYETNEIALKHIPDDVSEEDWKYLVNYFSSDEFKEVSARNKLNKAKQVINHRCGRKSFQAVSYDARDPETEKEPNFQELWRMTHTNNNGEWIDEGSKEIYRKVEAASSEMLQHIDEDNDEDLIINATFQSIVGERSGYCRGLGAGIKPPKGKSVTGLHEQLEKEREKREDIESKLKEVETQLQEERNVREEMVAQFEESQRQLEEKMQKQLEERMAAILFTMQSFSAGQSSGAMNIMSEPDERPSKGDSTTLRGEIQSKAKQRK